MISLSYASGKEITKFKSGITKKEIIKHIGYNNHLLVDGKTIDNNEQKIETDVIVVPSLYRKISGVIKEKILGVNIYKNMILILSHKYEIFTFNIETDKLKYISTIKYFTSNVNNHFRYKFKIAYNNKFIYFMSKSPYNKCGAILVYYYNVFDKKMEYIEPNHPLVILGESNDNEFMITQIESTDKFMILTHSNNYKPKILFNNSSAISSKNDIIEYLKKYKIHINYNYSYGYNFDKTISAINISILLEINQYRYKYSIIRTLKDINFDIDLYIAFYNKTYVIFQNNDLFIIN